MCIIRDFYVSDNADLAGKGTALANVRAAGDSDTGSNRGILANVHVVRNMDEVVEFYIALDHRVVERAAINSGARTDLHIITDHHPSQLRGLLPAHTITCITEPVTAHHHARVGM